MKLLRLTVLHPVTEHYYPFLDDARRGSYGAIQDHEDRRKPRVLRTVFSCVMGRTAGSSKLVPMIPLLSSSVLSPCCPENNRETFACSIVQQQLTTTGTPSATFPYNYRVRRCCPVLFRNTSTTDRCCEHALPIGLTTVVEKNCIDCNCQQQQRSIQQQQRNNVLGWIPIGDGGGGMSSIRYQSREKFEVLATRRQPCSLACPSGTWIA